MKKRFIIIVTVLMSLLITCKVSALTYSSSLSGGDTIFSKSDNGNLNMRSRTSLYIDVSNLDNISYLELYVSYDKSLVGISNCNSFNYIGGPCSTNEKGEVYFTYKYSDTYTQYMDKYHLYTVTFMYNNSTPKTGTTTVNVYFKNAKDKDGNSISISSNSKLFNFSEPYMKVPSLATEENIDSKNETDTQNKNSDISDSTKSNNANIKNDNTDDNKQEEINDNNNNYDKEKLKEKKKNNNTLINNKSSSDNKKSKLKISKRGIIIIACIGIISLIIICLHLIINYKENKKLNKKLKDFDEL